MKKYLPAIIVFLILCDTTSLWATHNRAGEITYVQLDELTVRCTITTYTKESSTNADRDSLVVFWGDGASMIVTRSNGPGNNGESLGNDIKKNVYMGTHTYPGRGTYTIYVEDPNRISDIQNIPNSLNVKFFLFTRLTLLSSQFQGGNSSVVLLNPPIDRGCVGRVFKHNPSAFDADDDSLSFELIEPFQSKDSTVAGYLYPDQVLPGPGNQISLNPRTGEFIWFTPPTEGDFNIAIQIKEYRQGRLINTMIRDMQIQILSCDNLPPIIEAPKEICVIAGDTIELDILAYDLDSTTDLLRLTATGGSFELPMDSSYLLTGLNYQKSPITAKFVWATNCNHIRKQPYRVVLKAEDLPPSPPSLTDLHTLSIKVIGPPPENLEGAIQGDHVKLTWDAPYLCENADSNYFYGFSVWRRRSSNPFVPDTCQPGLAGRGYEIIDFRSRNLNGSSYEYFDSTASRGITYCYRILGEFARTSLTGNPYNFVASLPSNEVCLQLNRDQPLLLNVDVTRTDIATGEIFVRWTKPLPEDLDTLARPGPYVYQLQRSIKSQNNFSDIPGARFIANQWSSVIDTFWTDQGLNTVDLSYDYRVDFTYGGLASFRVSESASSVYLSDIATDRTVILSWEEIVPWSNVEYLILRENDLGREDTIGQTREQIYVDTKLINEKEYCYRILAIGTYGIPKTPDSLINLSQRLCATPIDTVPPCAPDITATNDCEESKDIPIDEFYNFISWTNPANTCTGSDDVSFFIVYYRRNDTSSWTPIDTISNGVSLSTKHQPALSSSGCYSVTAVDSTGNESPISAESCVDNCPIYILPNAFTPDNNGQNDIFEPREKRFIARVDFKVYDRWGKLIFKTENPDLLWDGKNLSGKKLPTGTYFYKCIVFEQLYNGVQPQDEILSGFIELHRN